MNKNERVRYIILGLVMATLVNISVGIWLHYLLRFLDILTKDNIFSTILVSIGGGIVIFCFLYDLYKMSLQ